MGSSKVRRVRKAKASKPVVGPPPFTLAELGELADVLEHRLQVGDEPKAIRVLEARVQSMIAHLSSIRGRS